MIRRRGLVLGAAGGLAAPHAARPQPARPAVHALLVGIDNYRISPLRGCVNDVRLLEQFIRPLATSVTTIVDREASRAAFLRGWRDVVARCRAGDWLFFSFSGHGDRRPEAIPGSEADGLDDFLVFQTFHPREAPQEILLDNELEQMMAEQARRGVIIFMLADCCHAGTMTRSIHPAALGEQRFRTLNGTYPMGDLLAALASAPPPPPAPPRNALSDVTLFAGAVEALPVPEISYQGRWHGALSVAMSRLLDRMRDGERPPLREAADQVVRAVRSLGDGRQQADITLPQMSDLPFLGARGIAAPGADRPAVPPASSPLVRLRIDGQQDDRVRAAVQALRDVELVQSGAADLIWNPQARSTVSALGDLLSSDITPDRIAASAARVRAIRRLQSMTLERALDLRVEREASGTRGMSRTATAQWHNAAHPAGTMLRMTIDGLRHRQLVLFGIAGDGTVQFLFPGPSDPQQVTPGRPFVVDGIDVRAPFGADHAVAVALEGPAGPLVSALTQIHERREPLAAVQAVEAATRAGGWQVGLAGVFTRPA